MKVALSLPGIPDRAALRRAVKGLRSTDDASDELLAQLEEIFRVGVGYALPKVPHCLSRNVSDEEVLAAWSATPGNVSAVARTVNLSRSTVRGRLARLGVDHAPDAPVNDGPARSLFA